jgi:hypothetical protein
MEKLNTRDFWEDKSNTKLKEMDHGNVAGLIWLIIVSSEI